MIPSPISLTKERNDIQSNLIIQRKKWYPVQSYYPKKEMISSPISLSQVKNGTGQYYLIIQIKKWYCRFENVPNLISANF